MFRRPRQTAVPEEISDLLRTPDPVPVVPWGPLALHYLGVPIMVGIHMVVVQDEDYKLATQKLQDSGFTLTVTDRNLLKRFWMTFPTPKLLLEYIRSGYKRLDNATRTFNYPVHLTKHKEQLVLMPRSFPHLTLRAIISDQGLEEDGYDKYGNVLYPSERLLLESLVKCVVDASEWDSDGYLVVTSFNEKLRSWISMMVGYLGLKPEILDDCNDERAVVWYSDNFGRNYEEKHGPIDRHVSKRLGSGKEMMYDMSGAPVI